MKPNQIRPARRITTFRLRAPCATLLLFVAAIPTALGQAQSPVKTIEQGAVRIEYEARPQGMRLLYDGIEIFKASELIVTTPPWAPHHYVGPSVEAVISARVTDARKQPQITVTHRADNGAFDGIETIAITSDGVVEQTLTGGLSGDASKALVQWRIGAWNPSVIVGRPFAAKCNEDAAGTVPVAGKNKEESGSMFLEGVKQLTFNSRVGRIRIDVVSDSSLTFQDYRTSRWANPTNPYFWFGDLSSMIESSQSSSPTPLDYRIRYTFDGVVDQADSRSAISASIPVHQISNAQTGITSDPPTITPTPKQIEFQDGYFVVANLKTLAQSLNAEFQTNEERPPGSDTAAGLLLSEWRSRLTNHDSRAIESNRTAHGTQPRIEFGIDSQNPPLPDEGYRLTVGSNGIIVEAADAAGFRHAVQTIKQLSHVDANGYLSVRCCSICDWPSLSFRGVHLFTGGHGTAIHEMLLDKVIASLKMNKIVLEAEYIKWDSHPETHHPTLGMPKSEVRKLLERCERLGIEVIPLVQSLGHCQWIFANDANLDIAEDPDAKWAYCATNPRTYEFIFDVYAEAVALFKPRIFHIGHDEYADRGRVPFREESKKQTVESLFVMDTLKLHEWFKERNIEMMMWGDMLLAKGEGPDACHANSRESADRMRQQIPTDIVITDWHYADDAPESFTNLQVFHDAGFETIASTWNRPGNIKNFARAAFDAKSRGLLQTTWAGYSLDEESFQRNLPQYMAYVLAADRAWNADRDTSMDLLDAGQRFLDLCEMTSLKPTWRDGWTTDLRPACNYAIRASNEKGWFGLGPNHDLSTVPTGRVRLGGLRFDISSATMNSCIALQAQLSRNMGLPSKATLNVGAAADTLALIITSDFASPHGVPCAKLDVEFVNGSRESLELVYGQNFFAYADQTPAANAPVVWRGRSKAGTTICLRALIWNLPQGRGNIRSIVVQSLHASSSPVLLGLTGLESKQTP